MPWMRGADTAALGLASICVWYVSHGLSRFRRERILDASPEWLPSEYARTFWSEVSIIVVGKRQRVRLFVCQLVVSDKTFVCRADGVAFNRGWSAASAHSASSAARPMLPIALWLLSYMAKLDWRRCRHSQYITRPSCLVRALKQQRPQQMPRSPKISATLQAFSNVCAKR